MSSAAAAQANFADLAGRRLGRYEVLCLLASGGMATVYVARAQGVAGFERLVAIKVLHPHIAHDEDFISMFLDEARLAARIRHPNVVGTLDVSDTLGDGFFLVMDYVEGDHFGAFLRNVARAEERLPVPVVSRIVIDALAGLHAAHHLTDGDSRSLDLVHRDVSPHNILVGSDGVARITDFGVAKAQVRLSSTRDGQFKGKLSYMAPEQAASGEADQRSDLFSMGIVLWEALTGRRLFRGENNADVLNKILNPFVPPPSQFESRLTPFDPVVARALAKRPSERFQDADEFIEAIEEAANRVRGVATPRAVAREVTRWLGEKIDREREQIRNAIKAFGRTELRRGVLPLPLSNESGSSASQPSQVREVLGDDADRTVGAKPSTLAGAPTRDGNQNGLIVATWVVLLFLLGGAAAAWLLLGSDPPADTSEAVDDPRPEGSDRERAGPVAEGAESPARATANAGQEQEEASDGRDQGGSASEDARGATSEHRPDTSAAEPPDRPAPRRSVRSRRRDSRPSSDDTGSSTLGTDEDDHVIVNPYRR